MENVYYQAQYSQDFKNLGAVPMGTSKEELQAKYPKFRVSRTAVPTNGWLLQQMSGGKRRTRKGGRKSKKSKKHYRKSRKNRK